MWAPRRRSISFFLLPVSVFLFASGCHSSNCDLVEAELRTREAQLLDLRTERDQLIAHNHALQREVGALRGGSPIKMTPEEASQTYTLRGIVLGRQTGGLDDDGRPGDEALQVLVEPLDVDGHPIKVPGTLIVQAVEITPEGHKNPLSAWELSCDELRRAWKSGLFTTGYSLVLPWKSWPSHEKMRVVARLTLTDGRWFEAEKDITVRLVPAANRMPPQPDGPYIVPPPRKVEGTSAMWWKVDPGQDTATQPAGYVQPPKKPSLLDGIEVGAPVALPSQEGLE